MRVVLMSSKERKFLYHLMYNEILAMQADDSFDYSDIQKVNDMITRLKLKP